MKKLFLLALFLFPLSSFASGYFSNGDYFLDDCNSDLQDIGSYRYKINDGSFSSWQNQAVMCQPLIASTTLSAYVAGYYPPTLTVIWEVNGDLNGSGITYSTETLVYDGFWAGSSQDFYSRIISTDPLNNETVATTSDLGIDFYINEVDYDDGLVLNIEYNQHQTETLFVGLTVPKEFSESYSVSSGYNSFSTSTTYQKSGRYKVLWKIIKPGFLWDSTLLATTTYLIVGYKSGFDISNDVIDDATNQLIATTTSTAFINACNPISGSWDLPNCVATLFVPNSSQMQDVLIMARDGFLSKFPLGYLTDFVSILTSSSTTALPVISATIPQGIPGAGSHIDLSVSSSTFSFLFDETIGQFQNESASDTRSFYEITYDYWKVIVYLGLLFYIMGRILGSKLFFHHKI